ncbi:arylsulfatase [Halioglobus japonicus]|uniref:Arylsulfatase n=1 Tax=Halioglobus japonicus TaxID=930805 RepID=A0AAP8MFV7_9GAMM|nr:arylsulfatase [Halioglobus japonicus]PLW86659.1 arylsulfatase [Halioglobus japonicus]GHD11716.1 arylsulfatase [Halioglobus japonicus]
MKVNKSFLLALVLCLFSPFASASDKPNIVLVFLDNFGWGEPGFNGGGIIRGAETPRMDQLAAEGMRLTNFNVEVQCTPSRSAIMTGRYAIRSGNGTVPLGEGVYGLVQWEVTMAEMLSDAGYATGMFGKWHLGRTEGRFPTDQGFDEWYGVPNSTDESVYTSVHGFAESGLPETYVMESTRGMVPTKVRPYRLDYRPQIDRDLTDKAISFMSRQAKAEKPFFVYLPYTATHFPAMPHPDFAGKSGKGVWGDMLMQVDGYLGELLDTVDELGIRDTTIFIFTADNGPEALSAGETSMTVETGLHGSSGPWRSTLFTGYEGALRVPFAVRWPDKIAAGSVSDEIVHAMDLFPTLAKFAGGKVPDDRMIDGIDMAEFFVGEKEASGRDGFVVYMGNDIFGVKWRDWKLHFKEQTGWNGVLREYTMPRLYNLISDPQELDNVLFPHTWVPKAALPQLEEHVVSLKNEPPIPAGAADPYKPPR